MTKEELREKLENNREFWYLTKDLDLHHVKVKKEKYKSYTGLIYSGDYKIIDIESQKQVDVIEAKPTKSSTIMKFMNLYSSELTAKQIQTMRLQLKQSKNTIF